MAKKFLKNIFGDSSTGETGGQSVEELKAEIARLERAVNELSILSDLAFAIGGSSDPEVVIENLVDRLMRAVAAEQAVVTLVDREDTSSMQTNVRLVASSAENSPFHLKDAILGWMHLYKKPLVTNDPHNDEEFKGVSWDSAIRSVMCVPLLVKSELTGILSVYNKKGGQGFTPEDARLVTIIAGQSAQVIENARLYQESLQLARMRDEARNAYEIQRLMLPKPPTIEGYDLAADSVPAREVGGDHFDFIQCEDGRWAMCLADVSGKGLPAALLMSNVHATIRAQTHHHAQVAERISKANELLYQTTDDEKFVTMFYGELNTQTNELAFCNAGHEFPFHVTPPQGLPSVSSPRGWRWPSSISTRTRKKSFLCRRAT